MLAQYDILYIHSSKNPETGDNTRFGIVPMGIIAMLNTLRGKGYRVLGVNMAVEASLDPGFRLPELLKDIRYKVLLTDLHWYEHAYGAMYVAQQSKLVYPQVPVVIGGYTTTIYAEEILQNFSAVDYAVTGDSDLPLEQLMALLLGGSHIALAEIPNLVYREGMKIAVSESTWVQTKLDHLDYVSTDFFRHEDMLPRLSVSNISETRAPSQWLCVARGCFYNCAYCCGARDNMQALFRRDRVLTRSAEKVADDFIAIHRKGCRVSPSHDLQMFGKPFYKAVFARIRESGEKPAMYLEQFQLPTKDFVDEVARTFVPGETVLEISPISGNEQLRKENGKLFSNDQLYEIVKYIRSKGIQVQLYYTVNVVGETQAQFRDTLFQMKYLYMLLGVKDIFYQRVVIDPLAGMRSWEGVNAEYNTFMDYYRYCQIPHSDKLTATGFSDQGALSLEAKTQAYYGLFGK